MGQKIKHRQTRKPRNMSRHGEREFFVDRMRKQTKLDERKRREQEEFWSDPCWTDPLE